MYSAERYDQHEMWRIARRSEGRRTLDQVRSIFGSLARHAILVFVTLFTATVEAREIELASTRVTSADVAVSPDGASVVFSMLGHLFRVPAAGGTAEQLTFGPAYDKEPVYSPDGAALAFVSDRDGSESNIFLLSLRTGPTDTAHAGDMGRHTDLQP